MHFVIFVELVGYEGYFDVPGKTTSQRLPYDFSSIMHLRHNAFSHDIGNMSTILPRNQTIRRSLLGSSNAGTDLDFLHLNLVYCGGMGCKGSLVM